MANALARWIGRLRYGEPIAVVSGLPRSGTSMMMRMLEAGGLPLLTDGVRGADDDNPRGYYEYERVKRLERESDKSWLATARGKGLKVISHLLKELPGDYAYRVIFMQRDLREVIVSQARMLERRGEPDAGGDDARTTDLFRKHLVHVKLTLAQPNFELLEVTHRAALADPRATAERVRRFLGRDLDLDRMAAAVDPSLYRNRSEEL